MGRNCVGLQLGCGEGEAIRRTLGTLTPGKNVSGAEQHDVVEISVSWGNLSVFSYYFSYTKNKPKTTVWPDVSFAPQPMKFEKCQLCHFLCLKPQTGSAASENKDELIWMIVIR